MKLSKLLISDYMSLELVLFLPSTLNLTEWEFYLESANFFFCSCSQNSLKTTGDISFTPFLAALSNFYRYLAISSAMVHRSLEELRSFL